MLYIVQIWKLNAWFETPVGFCLLFSRFESCRGSLRGVIAQDLNVISLAAKVRLSTYPNSRSVLLR